MKVIPTNDLPIKAWLTDLEPGAELQAANLANLPFAYHHIAIMPDCHQGYGMPIGGVLATDGVVVPNAVGVDIGCGMCALRTNLMEMDRPTLKAIMGQIRETVPVGFSHHKEAQDNDYMPGHPDVREQTLPVVRREYDSARKQIGTLGGGNHFIEIQRGSDGRIWVMIHSGSRNIGKQVAEHYNKLAVGLNERWHSAVPKAWELAFLPLDSDEGQAYMAEMQYCVEFALANRKLMMARISEAIDAQFPGVGGGDLINIAHNYAAMEHHFGKNVLIHRKGATRARDGEAGIIPGSQGTKSYIVRGKGNRESFESCSHGAGRKMGRKQACRELSLEDEIRRLGEQGIVHAIRRQDDLDEAPGAYKDISEVMANQADLVDIVVELTPMGVIKG
ncbi:MAG: RtcB family protein [Acidobacteriales bacterium]|nr:RtcB family protein [Terriglobales bacterium]